LEKGSFPRLHAVRGERSDPPRRRGLNNIRKEGARHRRIKKRSLGAHTGCLLLWAFAKREREALRKITGKKKTVEEPGFSLFGRRAVYPKKAAMEYFVDENLEQKCSPGKGR